MTHTHTETGRLLLMPATYHETTVVTFTRCIPLSAENKAYLQQFVIDTKTMTKEQQMSTTYLLPTNKQADAVNKWVLDETPMSSHVSSVSCPTTDPGTATRSNPS